MLLKCSILWLVCYTCVTLGQDQPEDNAGWNPDWNWSEGVGDERSRQPNCKLRCMGHRSYEGLRKDLAKLLMANNNELAPFMVRLAWHSSGTYSSMDRTGGSNGARIRFAPESEDIANGGLQLALDKLKPLKSKYTTVSWADLITLAGATAIPVAGGPYVPWRFGRTDAPNKSTNPIQNGRLPAANKDASHVLDVFTRLTFNKEETAALNGAHVLGQCHANFSHFEGPWVPCNRRFSNAFFRTALKTRYVIANVSTNQQWVAVGRPQGNGGKKLMLLPTDKSMMESSMYNPYFVKFAANQSAFFDVFASAFSRLLELGTPVRECTDCFLKPTSCYQLTRDNRCHTPGVDACE